MSPLFLETVAADNYVAFTFFIGTMAMMAASVFFFFELEISGGGDGRNGNNAAKSASFSQCKNKKHQA